MKILGKIKTYSSKEIDVSRVSIGFECLDRGLFNPDKCYGPLFDSGIKYARVQTGWALCEKEKGVYTFEWLDKIVDRLIDGGVRPWFNVGFGNPLYMKDVDLTKNATCVGCVPIHYGEEVTLAWCNFVTALVEHYKDRVTHYEIWNEPDGEQFWYPQQPSGKEYAHLLDLTAEVIKGVQPSAKTGGSAMGLYNITFLQDFTENVTPKNLDFFAYHAYSLKPEAYYLEKVKNARELFDKNGLERCELWQGEGGCPSWYPEKHWLKNKKPGTERAQAVWVIRRFFLDLLVGATFTSYFQMADMWEKSYEKARGVIKKPAAHGILWGKTYEKKQAYYTISRIATVLSGEIVKTDKPIEIADDFDNEELIQVPFKRNGNDIIAYYKPYYVEDEIENRWDAKIDFSGTNIKNPVVIDLYSGDVYECESKDNIIIGAPIGQYPLLLCDKDTFETEK